MDNIVVPCFFTHSVECGPMPNVMAALPVTGDALCLTLYSLADAHYWSTVQQSYKIKRLVGALAITQCGLCSVYNFRFTAFVFYTSILFLIYFIYCMLFIYFTYWATVCKKVRLMLPVRSLSVLSCLWVTSVYCVSQTLICMDQDATWPMPHCVNLWFRAKIKLF